ncbi:hypothetical protein PV328_006304 [Microctonus aethiopoides]|uniref:Uncharacterized protein n=1 Tax=Microctonus aethiopoides TaxID=144406 RepID=A0AA39KTC6_9HYME|nr:hypothetical protein PV328_006304 [Microctonus aethiopoides]
MNQVSIVADKTIDIIQTCFSEHSHTQIISENLGQIFHRRFYDSNLSSIILINNKFKYINNNLLRLQIPIFILSIKSLSQLEIILLTIKSTTWWSIDSLFLILKSSKKSCVDASKILNITWELNLLSTLFICENLINGELMMYTYNPYTNRAPHPWKKIETAVNINNRWTLFQQKLTQGLENCASLNFDKTKFLDGYEMRVIGHPKTGVKWKPNKIYNITSFSKKLLLSQMSFFTNLFLALNVTGVVYYDYSGFLINGTASGYLIKLINGSCDMAINARTIYSAHSVSQTYPLASDKYVILSQHRNLLQPFEKILNYYSSNLLLLTIVVFIISFIVMLIYINYKISSAAFEILRLILNTSIRKPLKMISIRIYFFGIFVLIIVLTATFQGHLSAFLTKPERFNPDSIEDLDKLSYDIYLRNSSNLGINWLPFQEEHLNIIKGTDCYQYVLNDYNAACVGPLSRNLWPSVQYNLHISRKIIWEPYVEYWVRKDFPLLNKINIIRFWLKDYGLLDYWYNISEFTLWKKLIAKEAEATEAKYRPINIQDLLFAFKFWIIADENRLDKITKANNESVSEKSSEILSTNNIKNS